jgi:hypothetical protein
VKLFRYTGESAGVELHPRRPGRTRYAWERTWLFFGRKYVTITRHGKAAGKAHARLMTEDVWS